VCIKRTDSGAFFIYRQTERLGSDSQVRQIAGSNLVRRRRPQGQRQDACVTIVWVCERRSLRRWSSSGPFKETDVMSVFLCPHEMDETNLPGADLS